MLKKRLRLFLGLVVLTGSACVTPTHASSASSVIISYIQAAGPAGAKDEAIIMYNNGPAAQDITNWCLVNKSAVAFACFNDQTVGQFILPGYSYATVVSQNYSDATGVSSLPTLIYQTTNASSGSIVASNDTISLFDADETVIDTYGWSVAPSSGKAWERIRLFSMPTLYASTGLAGDWSMVIWVELPESQVEKIDAPQDEEDTDTETDQETELPETPHQSPSPLVLTEFMANPVGPDTGNEFIELFNTSDEVYTIPETLTLRIGTQTVKRYSLPLIQIAARGYVALYNTDIAFTLVNTESKIQLYDSDLLVDEVMYDNVIEGASWSYEGTGWINATVPTPGAPNSIERVIVNETVGSSQKPCAENQFRNPETGRCKLIASQTSSPTPCKIGQVRNPETNRCRSIATAATPTPCKVGQERNPETNRCRSVKQMTKATYGTTDVQTKASAQLQWYYIAAIAVVIIILGSYAVWEWRVELISFTRKLRGKMIRKSNE